MTCEPLFLFGLDSIVAREEVLPTIAEATGRSDEVRRLAEKFVGAGEIPFRESFLLYAGLFKGVPIREIAEAVASIPVHEEICAFMRERKKRCFIVTGNLDVWIEDLIDRIGMSGNALCSHGIVSNGKALGVSTVIDKRLTVEQFAGPIVAVGCGSNDADMISMAEVGIGFGGARRIASSVLEVCTHAIYEEKRLVRFLEGLDRGRDDGRI